MIWIYYMDTLYGYIIWIHYMDTLYGFIIWIHYISFINYYTNAAELAFEQRIDIDLSMSIEDWLWDTLHPCLACVIITVISINLLYFFTGIICGAGEGWRRSVEPIVWEMASLTIKPTRCTKFLNLFLEWNSTCFGQLLCPSSVVFHCTHSNGICHTGLLTEELSETRSFISIINLRN
jgi:hypothetical protein